MLELVVNALALTWALWVLVVLSIFAWGAIKVDPERCYFDGFNIHVPQHYVDMLPSDELLAVLEHEEGHRYHMHVLINLLRALVMMPATRKQRALQELEADDFVTDKAALARALMRLSPSGFDMLRALRLMQHAGEKPACARASGMDAFTHGG